MKKINTTSSSARRLLTAGLVGGLAVCSQVAAADPAKHRKSAAPSTAELARKLDAVIEQNRLLQEKVDRLEATQRQQATREQDQSRQMQAQAADLQDQNRKVQEQAATVAQVKEEVASSTSGTLSRLASNTTVGGYGEINYSRPSKSPRDAFVDVSRAVIGINHRFDDRTRLVTEFEWEHAIVSAGDKGESEVEQLWLEREFTSSVRGRVGLFLMPVGLVNQYHEPTAYYGVFRPDTDSKIVPSTWREAGAGVSTDLGYGVNLDFALTTAPNLNKWDPTSTEGRVRGPLQAVHGEGQYASAHDGGGVLAVNWRGIPGLWLGGSVVYDAVGNGPNGFAGNNSKLLLLDVHGRYSVSRLELAGEYIRGTLSNTEALNSQFALGATPNPTLVPHLFYGGYVQAAYRLLQFSDYRLEPFVRYEILNTAAGFGSLPVAAGGVAQPDERIWTAGASFRIGEGIVLKADYRGYLRNKLPDTASHYNLGDSFNLGAGFSF